MTGIEDAEALFLDGRYAEALAAFRAAASADPTSPQAQEGIARALYNLGAIDQAVAACELVLRINSQRAKPHLILSYAYSSRGNLVRSEVEARMAIAADPSLAEAHSHLGGVIAKQGRSGESIQYLKRAIDLDPGNWYPHDLIAWSYAKEGRYKEATAEAWVALRLRPSLRGWALVLFAVASRYRVVALAVWVALLLGAIAFGLDVAIAVLMVMPTVFVVAALHARRLAVAALLLVGPVLILGVYICSRY